MTVPATVAPACAVDAGGWDYRRGFELPSFGYREFGFPTVFQDSLAVTAVFPCSLRTARRELGRDDLEPLAIAPGTGCAVVSAYYHRSVSEMEAYNEAVLLIPARARGSLLPPLLPLWLSSAPRGFGHVPLAIGPEPRPFACLPVPWRRSRHPRPPHASIARLCMRTRRGFKPSWLPPARARRRGPHAPLRRQHAHAPRHAWRARRARALCPARPAGTARPAGARRVVPTRSDRSMEQAHPLLARAPRT